MNIMLFKTRLHISTYTGQISQREGIENFRQIVLRGMPCDIANKHLMLCPDGNSGLTSWMVEV